MLTIVLPIWEYEFKPCTSYVHLKSEKETLKPRTPKPKLSEDPPSYESTVRHDYAWHASSQFRPSAPDPPSFKPSMPSQSPTPPTPTPQPPPPPPPSKSRCIIS